MVTHLLRSSDAASRHTHADQDLKQRLMRFLDERQVPGGGSLEVEVQAGVVVLEGRLPSRHAKWLCIGCCRHVAGVIKLVDGIQVSATTRPAATELAPEVPQEAGEASDHADTGRPGTYVRVEPGGSRVVRHDCDSSHRARVPISSVALVVKEDRDISGGQAAGPCGG